MTRVMIAGKFDPIHDGHIVHLLEAAKLGDFLVVVTHTDDVVESNSKKGYCAVPLWARVVLLRGVLLYFGIQGEVRTAEPYDIDGTVTNSLLIIRPDIFAKGGDRTLQNMPPTELEICRLQNIEIRYGIGEQLNSSSEPEKFRNRQNNM